jgi:transcriptional regulator with XRE-family HTH domain
MPLMDKGEESVGLLEQASSLGSRLKELRRARGLTLAQLAEMTQLSVGSLSQAERGLTSPTIRTIYSVSTALGVSPAWILDPNLAKDHDPDHPYVLRAAKRSLVLNANGVIKQLATPKSQDRYKGFVVTVEPNGSSGDKQYSHAGEEVGIILTGAIMLEIGEKTYALNKGDSFAFPSNVPHRFYNKGSSQTVIFWINSLS